VLAAGASTRLGRAKQLVEVSGEALVHRAARVALEAGCHPVVVVEGAVPLAGALGTLAVERVTCAEWALGPGASLQRGLAHLEGRAEAVVVLLADQPQVQVEDVQSLVEADGEVAAAHYEGVLGVPARFAGAALRALTTLAPERGAGPWLRANAARVTAVPMPHAALDVDRPEDVARLLR
jgi:CTP:molybdopterin cytidylyltransferase MocA